MRDLLRLPALLAAVFIAQSAAAQETQSEDPGTAPAAAPPAESAAQGAQVQAYIKETHKDWRLVCLPVAEGRESCTMQQLMRDNSGNPVSQATFAPLPPAAAPRAAVVEIATPLETLLSEDLLIRIDSAEPKRYRFSYCTPQACIARFALTDEDVAAYKAGGEAIVTIAPLVAPDQRANITMSLSGFTAAFDAVAEIMAQ